MKTSEIFVTLNNKVEMPQFGYGSFQVTNREEGIAAISHAINTGYKMIDTADIYENHDIVREAIKQSNKDRKDLFITTKLWPTKPDIESYKKDFERFLKELDTDYIDLLLVHWPKPYGYIAYQAAEEIYATGKVKAIGVSNFDVDQLKDLLAVCNVKPTMNQIELNPSATRSDVVEFCKANDIYVTSWQTIMKGQIGKVDYIVDLANKHNVDAASIALKWAMQKGIVVIPKSVTFSRIESNLSNLDKFNLTSDEIKLIDEKSLENGKQYDSKTYIAGE